VILITQLLFRRTVVMAVTPVWTHSSEMKGLDLNWNREAGMANRAPLVSSSAEAVTCTAKGKTYCAAAVNGSGCGHKRASPVPRRKVCLGGCCGSAKRTNRGKDCYLDPTDISVRRGKARRDVAIGPCSACDQSRLIESASALQENGRKLYVRFAHFEPNVCQ
jgi:hypothetical protein